MAYKRPRKAFEADLIAQESPYVKYGTPLPPLDEQARDDGSYVPIWKQEVTDERGRKRFHGAFTGGFSAGYFNTVGSKEGWTPSTFVSSRTDRHRDRKTNGQQKQQQLQRPEDFMDEEDLAEAEESRTLETTAGHAAFGSTEHDQKRRDVFMDIFRPQVETAGMKLLRKMGWRDGHGIGPRVRRASLSQHPDVGSEHNPNQLYAPKNSLLIAFDRKSDRKGLGFSSEAALDSLGSSRQPTGKDDTGGVDRSNKDDFRITGAEAPQQDSKHPQRGGGGIGVGVLNAQDSDEDEDPYSMGPRISYNRVMGGDKKSKMKDKKASAAARKTAANPLLRDKPVFVSKKATTQAEFRKCHDGRLPLDGFLLSVSTAGVDGESEFLSIEIPAGWKSQKTPNASVSAFSSQQQLSYLSTADAAKRSTLDPSARAAMLGEAQLPGKSVFDFMSPAARERIAAATGRNNLPPALGESIPGSTPGSGDDTTADDEIPPLDKETAIAALGRGVGGWMPYADNEAKRGRYQDFLRYRGGLISAAPRQATELSRQDWTRELAEFAHAARVFRPVTGAMASRFTSSKAGPNSGSKDPGDTGAPLLQSGPGARAEQSAGAQEEDPAEAAARMGMFGPLTRSVHQFFPTRLVCKRFGVRPPAHVQADAEAATKASAAAAAESRGAAGPASAGQAGELVSQAAMAQMLHDVRPQAQPSGHPASAGRAGARAGAGAGAGAGAAEAVDAARNEALEGQKAGEAVFKAIFGDSDDSEDDD